MTHTQDTPNEDPAGLGHMLHALDRVISSDLHDKNHVAARNGIAALNDLTAHVNHLSDAQAREVLDGILRSMHIRHKVAQANSTVPNRRSQTPPAENFVAGTPCGHRHTIGNYADGCAYATHTAWATTAAHNNDHDRAQHHAVIADLTLAPLADINNPDSLRDFIAGAHSGFETHLRTLGTNVPT